LLRACRLNVAARNTAIVFAVGALVSACGAAATTPPARVAAEIPARPLEERPVAKSSASLDEAMRISSLLCGDLLDERSGACLAACESFASPSTRARCLIDFRFSADHEARLLARALYEHSHVLPAISPRVEIEGYRGTRVAILPATPIDKQRHHLRWLRRSLDSFESFISEVSARAPRKVTFDVRPEVIVFFRTAGSSYPSAFVDGRAISYNLDGPLHRRWRDMHETLFHELFHVNDGQRDNWSEQQLVGVFDAILDRCSASSAKGVGSERCFRPFAPYPFSASKARTDPGAAATAHDALYAFDERTREVREYAAEVALRYFLEHERIFNHEEPIRPPFKCLNALNARAWTLMADEFFGGLDLAPRCSPP